MLVLPTKDPFVAVREISVASDGVLPWVSSKLREKHGGFITSSSYRE